jgi:hypothetical protein
MPDWQFSAMNRHMQCSNCSLLDNLVGGHVQLVDHGKAVDAVGPIVRPEAVRGPGSRFP